MSGVTDGLIKLAHEVSPAPTEREMDVLLATGEQTTIALLAMAIDALGARAVSLTGAQAGIVTDGVHTKAKIANITPKQILHALDEGFVVIVAGFQGQTMAGQVTTLGRGGSDLTAIAIASAIGADLCQIFTDVDGVYTCDPRLVPTARRLEELSYEEMLEMASLGSKVMQSRSVEFAKKFGVRFEVRSSFNDNPGTMIIDETPSMENVVIRGLSVEKNQAKVTVGGVPDRPGTAARVFNALAEARVVIDMIVQNVSAHGQTDISFTLNKVRPRRGAGSPAARRGGDRRGGPDGQGRDRQAQRRGHRDALALGRGGEAFRLPGARRHQHPDDHHERDQNRGHHRRGQRGRGRQPDARRLRAGAGRVSGLIGGQMATAAGLILIPGE